MHQQSYCLLYVIYSYISTFDTGLLTEKQWTPEYFPPCMVSQCAATGLAVFDGTGPDTIDSVKRLLPGIGSALDYASVEVLRFYALDVQVDYGSEVHRSYRLMSLYYDGCLMFGHACRLSLIKKFGLTSNCGKPV